MHAEVGETEIQILGGDLTWQDTEAIVFPIREAAPIALRVVLAGLPGSGLAEVRFVVFSEEDLQVYKEAWREMGFAG